MDAVLVLETYESFLVDLDAQVRNSRSQIKKETEGLKRENKNQKKNMY